MEEGLTKCHIRPSFFSAFPNVFFDVFGLFAYLYRPYFSVARFIIHRDAVNYPHSSPQCFLKSYMLWQCQLITRLAIAHQHQAKTFLKTHQFLPCFCFQDMNRIFLLGLMINLYNFITVSKSTTSQK